MTDRLELEEHLIVTEDSVDLDRMASSLAEFLTAAGLPGAAETGAPQKTAEAWSEVLLAGYRKDPNKILGQSWPDRTGELVTMRAVPFVSVCEHHLLPFYGEAHLAYLPDGQLTGLSRLANLVDCLARRLQVQERLTEQLVDVLMSSLRPRGAACILEAVHDCVGARTLQHRGSKVQTVAYRGEFKDNPAMQDRLLRLVLGGGVPGL
jgi:GTP cyclohydrolase I